MTTFNSLHKAVTKSVTKSVLAGSFLCMVSILSAQDVRLTNPSFEDTPRQGSITMTGVRTVIKNWHDCGAQLFPKASPPDIHQGSTNYWANEIPTAHGKTYMSLVVREDDSYESVSQKVMGTLKAGQCYKFSVDLVQAESYLSPTKNYEGQISRKLSNFNNPTVFQLYGGNSTCDFAELLAESKPVTHNDWRTYEFKLEPTTNYTHVVLMAFYKTPTLVGYNGHICLDNASHFTLVECNDETVLYAQAKTIEEPEKKIPAHKRKPSKKPAKPAAKNPIVTNDTKTTKVETPKPKEKPKKILSELDRKSLKVGNHIRLKKLTFEADKVDIDTSSYEELVEVYDFLDYYQEVVIEIGGHTNAAPSHEYCDKLSTERAKAVADYLIDKGISKDRITYKGYGKRRPLYKANTKMGRKLNPRVQIQILSLG